MTSRRKQNKPIKAPLQSSDKYECLIKSTSCSVEIGIEVPVVDYSPITTTSNMETDQTMITEDKQVDAKPESDIQTSKTITDMIGKIDENPVRSNIFPIVEDNSDDISKKINKDEAKILPFQTSGGVDFFKCPMCDQSYICGRESLTVHLQEHQNKMKRDDGKHLCCLCSKELSSNSSLERHLLTHSNHRPFSCFMCDKKFTTNGNLSRHIKTSHNNNETIESSIDEVLKKHQTEIVKSPQNVSNDIKTNKIKKSSKPIRKDKASGDLLRLDNKKLESGFMLSPQGLVNHRITEPIFKTILPTNMNFLSPLLSLNIGDFSFLHQSSPDNLSLFPSKPIQIIPNSESIPSDFNTKRIFTKTMKFDYFKFFTQKNHRKSEKYLEKRRFCLNSSRKLKKHSWNYRVRCRKCLKVFWRISRDLILHVKNCNEVNKKELKYCIFKFCNCKFRSKVQFIRHIKNTHLKYVYDMNSQSSLTIEPLNLCIKSNNTPYLFTSPSESLTTQSEPKTTYVEKFEHNYVNSNYQQKVPDNILDFSIAQNSQWNFGKSFLSKISPLTAAIQSFQSTNQFISSSPLLTASPISLSSSFKSDWNGANKLDFNDNSMIHLNSRSPTLDIGHPQISNLSTKSCVNSTIEAIAKNTVENLSSKSIPSDFGNSNPLLDDIKLKYNTANKKKNSYKDAPKLITCPMEGCAQKFPWNSSLMRHILTHTAHKPFKCTRCTKCFSTKSNRERHMTRVHGVRINRSKFKSIQAAKATFEESSKLIDENADSENGNLMDETVFPTDKEINITELSEEEWIIMDNNDRRAEDISNNLLKLAGQPLVEPNPVRLNNNQISLSPKSEFSSKPCHSISKERFYLDSCF